VPTVPVTVWVGQHGMVSQVSLAVDLSHATIGGLLGGSTSPSRAGSGLAITVGFTHCGQPVSISVSPASEVTDLNSIIGAPKDTMGKVGSTVSDLISRVLPPPEDITPGRAPGPTGPAGTIVGHGTRLRRHRSREEMAAALG
jgi:hypothetical protein